MNHREAGEYWDRNAEAWSRLARAGWDTYRDAFNTPAFLEMLPDVRGLCGLDIGCGEGANTREVARRGARMAAVDISPTFVRLACEEEAREPLGIRYGVASAVALPFDDGAVDFATSFMCLMDIPETAGALAEAHRVLRPGGFLQFSITHPCFDTPHRRNLRGPDGITRAIEVGGYFTPLDGALSRWTFSAAPAAAREGVRPFEVPRFNRTLGEWLNLLIGAGFVIERVGEPRPDDETVRAWPSVQDAQVVAYFLHVRARKAAIGV
ncbi:MAG: methyltransferase domain-containing protein [Candidatus Brocadiae bacterium]|nr:methyltransferase domain-containing protein [Candidatus Brocadiia bacterium]